MIVTVMKESVLTNIKTGEKLILDLDSPNVGILTPEEFEKSTLGKRRFRKDAYIDEKVYSDFDENDDYPSQEEIEREVEEALKNIEID